MLTHALIQDVDCLRILVRMSHTPELRSLVAAFKKQRDDVREEWEQSDESNGPCLRGRSVELAEIVNIFENAGEILHRIDSKGGAINARPSFG